MIDLPRPSKRATVYDLLEAAGVDVSRWSDRPAKHKGPKDNPTYCYAWSFSDSFGHIAITIWFNEIQRSDNGYYVTVNARSYAKQSSGRAKSHAEALDNTIGIAYSKNLPLRAIIVDGSRRGVELPVESKSNVKKRALDSEFWHVSAYDEETGSAVLRRGAPVSVVDQFDMAEVGAGGPTRRHSEGYVFVRSPKVRLAVLRRSNGRCEYCNVEGFRTQAGVAYLETHHITSLADGGLDVVSNVVALCANHHREAHYGTNADGFAETLKKKARLFKS